MGKMMNDSQFGFYLFPKDRPQAIVLKEMLQFLRTQSRGKSPSFSFVESETSLIPHLTLWENLHVVSGGQSWKEFTQTLEGEWGHLANLIQQPNGKAEESTAWERLAVSLLKATLTSGHVLVDIEETQHSPFNLQLFKKALVNLGQTRNVFIASANTSLWLDSVHSLVTREGFDFKVTELDQRIIKRHRIA